MNARTTVFTAKKIPRNILITGLPGVGKTTLIQRLIEELRGLNPVGFFTREIREKGVRQGFELESLDGQKGILSHVKIGSTPGKGHYPQPRVGKYGVDVEGLERFLEKIPFLAPETRLVIIDEIGKMECFSVRFQELLRKLLDSEKCLVATVAMKGAGIIAEIKARPDIKLFVITERNRNSLPSLILNDVKQYFFLP